MLKKKLWGLILTICMIALAVPLNVNAITLTEEREVLKEINELKGEIKLLKNEINELKEVIEEFIKENLDIKEAPSDTSYEKPIVDFTKYGKSGYSTSYMGKWDKVTNFKVADEIYGGEAIFGFKFTEKKLRYSDKVEFPYLSISNLEHKNSKLKFSYAIDDIAKDYSIDKKPYIYVYGYSELRGYEEIIVKPIERNEQIQTLELDINNYTEINIVIIPRTKDTLTLYYSEKNAKNTHTSNVLYEDYILLMNVQMK